MYSGKTVAIAAGIGFVAGAATIHFTVVKPLLKRVDEVIHDLNDVISENNVVEDVHEVLVDTEPATTVYTTKGDEELTEAEGIILDSEYISVNDESVQETVDFVAPVDTEKYHQVGIKIVPPHEFSEMALEGMDVTYAKYFPEDDILVDGDDVPVEDVEDLVGTHIDHVRKNTLSNFADMEANHLIEVTHEEGSYADYINGRGHANDPLYAAPERG